MSKIRSLASDTVVYGVSTVVGRFLTFLLTPLYTNYLSAEEIGQVAAIYAMIAFVNIAYSMGMETAFMRFYEREDDGASRKAYTVAFTTIVVLGAAITGSILLFAGPIAGSSFVGLTPEQASLVRLAAFMPLLDALVLIPFARLRMQRKPKVFALYRLWAIVVNVALNVAFVVNAGWRLEGVIWAGVLSSVAAFALFIPSIIRNLTRLDMTLVRDMMRFGLPTVPSSLSSIIVQMVDRPIMIVLTGAAALGMYQTNYRLALPMMMFITVFEYAWRPFYLHHRDDADATAVFRRVLTLFTAAAGAIFLVTTLFMPYVVSIPFVGGRFINPEYWSGMTIIPIVMLATFINGLLINIAAGYHIAKRTMVLPLATGLSAAVNIGATFWLVPMLGIDGAAWAKVGAYVAGTALLLAVLPRVYPIRYDWWRVTYIIIATAAVFLLITELTETDLVGALLRGVAVIVYIAMLFAGKIITRSSFRFS
jgi:O-antigen/teichoic acid export membrane protein